MNEMNNKNEFFSVIIPTMWKSDKIHQMLESYQSCNMVKEIIIIDNNPKEKPNLDKYSKIIYYTEGKNLYVNPSWNIGYSLSNYKTILANDDILIRDLTKVLELIKSTEFDLVGVQLGELNGDMKIETISKFPENSFGVFMYVKYYTYIPEQIKIWFGDNILFDNSNKKGILKNAGITANEQTNNPQTDGLTVKYIRKNNGDEIIKNDRIFYSKLKSPNEEFNIIVRTSGRENYFKHCVNSIKTYYPKAKVHITLDDISDLNYVESHIGDLNWVFYLINKKTILEITNKIKINREPRFIFNYYFNIVRPFINGWVMFLDDDDELINTPLFDWSKREIINLYKANLINKTVPSTQNFGKKPVLNDISTLCVILHSKNLIDWIPNRGGDYDFINELYSKYNTIWHNTIHSKIQKNEGHGNRKDRIDEKINGFYLNLDKREDRKIKMEDQLKKTTHLINRFTAIDGTKLNTLNGFKPSIRNSETKQYATYLSHLNMIKLAKQNNWDKVLILEYDITLCNDFDVRLEMYLNQLPNDWKIAYIGFTETEHTKLSKITDYVHRVTEVYGCWGMIINSSFYDTMINIIKEKNTIIDKIIKDYIQPNYGCYVFLPFLAYVNDDYSDLWNANRNLSHIRKYYKDVLFTKNIITQNITPQISKQEQIKNEKREFLKNFQKEKKVINYDKINELLNKNNGYNIESSKKPIRTNPPAKREEINELKKGSLSKMARDLSGIKEKKKTNLPNIFSKKN